MKIRPFVLAASAAITSILFTPISSASAAGVAPVGSTITATAWERGGLDDFAYTFGAGEILPKDGFEEYVYRVYNGSTLADVQSPAGYDSLTEAEQYEWYIDAGYATYGSPYEFRWTAFACLAAPDVASTDMLITDDITLNEMHYVAADEVFPSDGRDFYNDYVFSFQPSLVSGTAFGVDGFVQDHMSSTGYSGLDTGNQQEFPGIAFSASYPEFECGDESQLYGFTILDSANINDRATVRDLEIGETLHIDNFGQARELEAAGVFIGVTGVAPSPFTYNAALWGMTKIGPAQNNGEPLANTGPSDPAIAALAGVFAVVVGLAIATRVSRRRV